MKKIPQIGGVGGLAEAAGGVRGGKLPEFGRGREYEALSRTLRSLSQTPGCGGLNSLRATAAPLLESDIRFAAMVSSFRQDFAVFWQKFAGFPA